MTRALKPWRLGTISGVNARGFGFITPDDQSLPPQVFFHFRTVHLAPGERGSASKYRALENVLKVGDRVLWRLGRDGGKGPRAEAVKMLEAAELTVVGGGDGA